MRILFICLGNICRSCTAEEIFRTFVRRAGREASYIVDSAGLIDFHEGELPDERMRAHARRHGYKLTHRSRPVKTADFKEFDWLVAMDEQNRDRLLHLAPESESCAKILMMADYLTQHPDIDIVPDPYYGSANDFELVIELLEDACQGLLEALEASRTE